MKIGDLVRWPKSDSIALIFDHPISTAPTGIITTIRKMKWKGPKEYDVSWEAEVLCGSGRLCWYPMEELVLINEEN